MPLRSVHHHGAHSTHTDTPGDGVPHPSADKASAAVATLLPGSGSVDTRDRPPATSDQWESSTIPEAGSS